MSDDRAVAEARLIFASPTAVLREQVRFNSVGGARAETKRQVIKESCNHPSRLVLLLRRFALCGVLLDRESSVREGANANGNNE